MTTTATANGAAASGLDDSVLSAPATGPAAITTPALLNAMLDSGAGISDLFFSPGRPPQVEKQGVLTAVAIPQLPMLRPEDTSRLARDLVGQNAVALRALKDDGSCDMSYSLPERCRFRVNVFRQRGTFAIVMRVIAQTIPTLADLHLPATLADAAALKNGIVLVTGPTGSGKSSTLAAIINLINETRAEHILTIEDPIEFLHQHKKGTVHQRELHSDTPTFALALRAALRQAPKVILVGEMRDRETIEIALTAAETGHLVFSTLHTIDASKTVDRIVGSFDASEERTIRTRLAASFRYFISQRLIPTTSGGRCAVLEILKATLRTREYIERGNAEGRSLLDAMRDGELDGMQYFDGEIEKLVRGGVISFANAMLYSTNPGNLRVQLVDVADEAQTVG
ncbi:MAG TPA: PilT/PilU family type 4a pilus ATPase [Vicinamibacterales bacterium]|nr:PilT/PilU family type 4a pilus ATPase [Vicinamibacterales bacterium]